jgi:hypothetical protein
VGGNDPAGSAWQAWVMIVGITEIFQGRDRHASIPAPGGLLFARGGRGRLASPAAMAGSGAGVGQVSGE